VVPGKFQLMHIHFIKRMRALGRARGFSIVELMIALAVAAILAMIAVPSFRHLMLVNRLDTTANALVDQLNLARLDAIKLNASTQFCGSTTTLNTTNNTLGVACGTEGGAVYSLPQSSSTAGQVRATPPGITAPLQVGSSGIAAVRFSGQGFGYAPSDASRTPYAGRVAMVCTSDLSSDNQRVINMTTGSILAVASSTGACP
jgi:type IV fimbrial biogenesis protein FimT